MATKDGGRKIDVFKARGKVIQRDFEIRVCRSGEEPFFARYDDQIFSAANQEELEHKLTRALRASENVTWERFIEVNVPVPEVRQWGLTSHLGGMAHARSVDMYMNWRVIDLSSPLVGAQGEVRLYRVLEHDRETGMFHEPVEGYSRQADTYRVPDNAQRIPFTLERFMALLHIERSIASMRGQLHALLHSDEAGARLEAAGGNLRAMLPAHDDEKGAA